MHTDVSSHYQEIALALSSTTPAEWSKTWITANVQDGVVESQFDYVRSTGEEAYFMVPTDKRIRIADALLKLRQEMTQPGQKPWSFCTFTLFDDGTFKFDVKYDD